jgi:hypothetical protein
MVVRLVLVLAFGCASLRSARPETEARAACVPRGAVVADGIVVGVAVAVDSAAVVHCHGLHGDLGSSDCAFFTVVGTILSLVAVPSLVGGVVGVAAGSCPSEVDPARGRQLAERLLVAARDGNCVDVVLAAPEVKRLDEPLYDSTFITDPHVSSCLADPVAEREACSRRRHAVFDRARHESDPFEQREILKSLPSCND